MDFKLIASTFIVIFLAELGDKTQFAAMAASAGSNKPVSILIGTILALALSSIIAVAAGSLIGELIPVRYIKIAAGIVFLVFGILYIREAFVTESGAEEKAGRSGLLSQSVLKAAHSFEEEELQMFRNARELVELTINRQVIDSIIQDEEAHLDILKEMNHQALEEEPPQWKKETLPETVSFCSDEDNGIIGDLYNRENAMADFYRIASEKTRIPSVRRTLLKLSREEESHAKRLQDLIC